MNRSCIVFVTYIYKYMQHTVLQSHTTSSNFIATQLACHILIVTFGYFLMFGSLLKWTKAGVALLGQFRSAGHWWEWLKFPGRNSSEGTYAGTTATLMKIMYMLLIQKEFCEVTGDLNIMSPLQIFPWWLFYFYLFPCFIWSLGSGQPVAPGSFPQQLLSHWYGNMKKENW